MNTKFLKKFLLAIMFGAMVSLFGIVSLPSTSSSQDTTPDCEWMQYWSGSQPGRFDLGSVRYYAVRFSKPADWDEISIHSVKIVSASEGTIRVCYWNSTAIENDQFWPVNPPATSDNKQVVYGGNEWDVSSYNWSTSNSEFFIGIEQVGSSTTLCSDMNNEPENRSYRYEGSEWEMEYNFMANYCISACVSATQATDDDPSQTGWVRVTGSVSDEYSTPLCAMALANGQYMFTCGNDLGFYDLEVPIDSNGEVTLYGFCSGYSPFKTILGPGGPWSFDINMNRAPAGSREMEIVFQTEPGITNPNWTTIWGTVTYDGQDLCAMVLANGQNMFSCGNNLGTFDLEVPLDGNGEITLYVFCSGFAPYKYVFAP